MRVEIFKLKRDTLAWMYGFLCLGVIACSKESNAPAAAETEKSKESLAAGGALSLTVSPKASTSATAEVTWTDPREDAADTYRIEVSTFLDGACGVFTLAQTIDGSNPTVAKASKSSLKSLEGKANWCVRVSAIGVDKVTPVVSPTVAPVKLNLGGGKNTAEVANSDKEPVKKLNVTALGVGILQMVPTKPILIISTVADRSVTLNFKAVEGALNYNVERCLGLACKSDYAVVGAVPVKSGETSIQFADTSVLPSTTYSYRIRPVGSAGLGDALEIADLFLPVAQIVPVTLVVPAAVGQFVSNPLSDSSVTLSWVDNSGSALVYEVQRCTGIGCSSFSNIVDSPVTGSSQSVIVNGMVALNNYSFRVRAVNAAGAGEWRVLANVQMLPPPILGLAASNVTKDSATIGWTVPSDATLLMEIERCKVTASSGTCVFFALPESPLAAGVSSFVDTPLLASTSYRYRIRTRNATGGLGSWATSSNVTTQALSPAGFSVSAISGSEAALSWTDASVATGEQYRVEVAPYSSGSCGSYVTATVATGVNPTAAEATNANVINLQTSSRWCFRVRTEVGTTVSAFVTQPNIPLLSQAALGFAAAPTSSSTATLSWTDATLAIGDVYRVEAAPYTSGTCGSYATASVASGTNPTSSDVSTLSVSGLGSSAAWCFRVRNEADGLNSAYTTIVNSGMLPTAVTLVSNTSTDTVETLVWNKKADVTSYTIERCDGAGCSTGFMALGSVPQPSGATVKFVDTELIAASSYVYRVRAINAQGAGDFLSVAVTSAVAPPVPDPVPATPTGLSAVATTSTSVTLTWTDASTNETFYQVDRCTGVGCTSFAPIAESPLILDSISIATVSGANTVYSFRVRAVGVSGPGAYANVSNVLTPVTNISSASATAIGSSSVTLSWTAGDSSGETEIQVCPLAAVSCLGTGVGNSYSQALPATNKVAAGLSTYLATGLTAANVYSYRARTVKTANTSDWTVFPDVSTTVDSPATVFASSTGGIVTLNWSANGASPVPSYQVQACLTVSCLETDYADIAAGTPTTSPALNVVLSSLAAESSYLFRVRALGASAPSNSPWVYSPSRFATVPAAATFPVSNAVTSLTATGFTLNWTDNSSIESLYEIQTCTSVGCGTSTTIASIAAGSASFVFSGLTANTSYYVRVRPVGLAGNGAYSAVNTVITLPLAPTAVSFVTKGTTTVDLSITTATAATHEVQYCAGSGCIPGTDTTVTATTAIAIPTTAATIPVQVTGLSSGTRYTFRVRTRNTSDATVFSAWFTNSSVTNVLTNAAAVACTTTPQQAIIDAGQKGSVAGVARGVVSSTKVIPGTNSPAVAYFDSGNATIKYAWWNGTQFVVETVAGASGSGVTQQPTSIKLEFLNGTNLSNLSPGSVVANARRPMIFWTSGVTAAPIVRGAMRTVEGLVPSITPLANQVAGTWAVSNVETQTSGSGLVQPRGIDAAVSPTDQVMVSYMTDSVTAAGSRMRVLTCDAGCSALGSFSAPGTTDVIDLTNAAVTAGVINTGAAFCPSTLGGNIYLPAVTWASGVTLRYAVCNIGVGSTITASSISACSVATPNTKWYSASVVAAAVVGGALDMHIDPTVPGDKAKILHKIAAGTVSLSETASACDNATQGTLTTGAVSAGTAVGSLWGTLMKDSNGKFVIAANEGTTSAVYFNTASTSVTGTLNTVGVIDTVTLATGGFSTADLGTSNNQLYVGYGTSAGDLTMGVVNDAVNVASSNSSQVYYQLIPDAYGNMLLPVGGGGQIRNVAVQSTSSGKFGAAYVDYSIGAAAAAKLKYAYRNGGSTTQWVNVLLPGTQSPQSPSLAYDSSDRPWVSFYDGGTLRYYAMVNSQTDGQGTWTKYQFPQIANAAATAPATHETAMAMSYTSGVASPLMIIMNSSATGTGGIKASKLNITTGVWNTVKLIDTLATTGFGTKLVADFDTNSNKIVIAWNDIQNNVIKYNATVDGGVNWISTSPTVVAASAGREGLSIKLNPITGLPAISYYLRAAASSSVLVNTCTTTPANTFSYCSLNASWASPVTAVASAGSALGTSSIAAAQEQLLSTSLSYASDGVPSVSYSNFAGSPAQGLSIIGNPSTWGATTGAPVSLSAWLAGTSYAMPDRGTTPTAFNYASAGWAVTSLRNNLGQLLNAYIGPNNWLYATTCE